MHKARTYKVPKMTAVLSLRSATGCDLQALNAVQVCCTGIPTLLFESRNKVQQLHHIYSSQMADSDFITCYAFFTSDFLCGIRFYP